MNNLKSCPFCGGKVNTIWNTKYDWQIACENESCFLHEDVIFYKAFETEEAAVEAWNHRTSDDMIDRESLLLPSKEQNGNPRI